MDQITCFNTALKKKKIMPEKEEWGQCRSTGWWCQDKYKESRKGEVVSLRGHRKFGGEINNLGNGMGGRQGKIHGKWGWRETIYFINYSSQPH